MATGNHSSIHPNTTNAKWKTEEINLGKKFNKNKSTTRSKKKRTFRTNATSMPISTKTYSNYSYRWYLWLRTEYAMNVGHEQRAIHNIIMKIFSVQCIGFFVVQFLLKKDVSDWQSAIIIFDMLRVLLFLRKRKLFFSAE